VELGKACKGAVVGLFDVGGEDAGGEFVVFEVVGDALTAFALAGAGFVGAGAAGFVGFEVTFHRINSLFFSLSVTLSGAKGLLRFFVAMLPQNDREGLSFLELQLASH
jgi:hypothetical protein